MRFRATKAPPLLRNFFKLGAEHIYRVVNIKVTAQRDVKPVALFAFNDESAGTGTALREARFPSCGDCTSAGKGNAPRAGLPENPSYYAIRTNNFH
jgi:hypothetical protein